ncbi:hypothetical protein AB0O91_13505 [Kitasatospora sp. NPDC089797]
MITHREDVLKRLLRSTVDGHGVYPEAGLVPHPDPEKPMVLGGRDGR